MTRRQLSAGLVGLSLKAERRIVGGFADSGSHETGHRLRDRSRFAEAKATVRVPVAIVGGGMAGLSAAWWLDKHRMRDYVVLEMERQAGGNSRWGEGEAGAYPWAAHYIPVPAAGAGLVRELLGELGLLQSDGTWEERHLCHSPQERLFIHGRWQDGLEPELGSSRADREEYRRFQAKVEEAAASGEFRIPLETGACRRADLDSVSFEAWLRREGFTSAALHWYAGYACRDDYGAGAAAVSAWAGLHYFAARRDAGDKGPLTWPEGNGWVARRLIERVGPRLKTGEFIRRIERAGNGWRVRGAGADYLADTVIFAAPQYLLPYLMDKAPARAVPVYSPWLTANLTLDRWPAERGLPVAWDNVIYRSPALGYVVSTHQSLRTRIDRTVWTYYWALAEMEPAAARRALLERDWHWWKEAVLTDLEQAHPDIRACVSRVDIMRFGHAMARPAPGFLQRRGRTEIAGGFWLANSDASGLSIFEEAQYRGVEAARRAMARLGGR